MTAPQNGPSSMPGSDPLSAQVDAVLARLRDDPVTRAQFAAILADDLRPRAFYTAKTLAVELGLSERTIRRAIADGELAATRRAGRWVMTVEDARAWVLTGPRPLRAPHPAATGRRPLVANRVLGDVVAGLIR